MAEDDATCTPLTATGVPEEKNEEEELEENVWMVVGALVTGAPLNEEEEVGGSL